MKDILEDSKHFMHIEAIPDFGLYGFEVIGGALSSADAKKIKTENWYHIGESERFKVIERQVKELWEYSHPKAFSQPSFKGWSTEKNGERFYHIKSFIKERSLYDSKETQFRYW